MVRADRGAILDGVDDLASTVRLHAGDRLDPGHPGRWPAFARRYPDEVFAEVCADPRALIAGTLNPAPARAEQVDGGYVFTGTATYLSGSAHATWLMTAAVVTRNGKPVFDAGGIDIRSGLFPLDQATSLDNWNVTGMRATGSSDYAFKGITVEEAWTFAPLRPPATPPTDVLAAIPLWSQLGGARRRRRRHGLEHGLPVPRTGRPQGAGRQRRPAQRSRVCTGRRGRGARPLAGRASGAPRDRAFELGAR